MESKRLPNERSIEILKRTSLAKTGPNQKVHLIGSRSANHLTSRWSNFDRFSSRTKEPKKTFIRKFIHRTRHLHQTTIFTSFGSVAVGYRRLRFQLLWRICGFWCHCQDWIKALLLKSKKARHRKTSWLWREVCSKVGQFILGSDPCIKYLVVVWTL